jgi:bifunctional non-homologous end joining protein LigD
LSSRGGLNYTKRFPAVVQELEQFDFDAILDGEVVALREDGKPDFDAIQKIDVKLPLAFYVFDIPWCKGYNLMRLPLTDRKNILANTISFN